MIPARSPIPVRSPRRFAVVLDDPTFAFNASHFVAFPVADGSTWFGEPIHGHDLRPKVRVDGPRDASGCVVDFIAASRILRKITASWEHKTFLAKRVPCADCREYPATDANPAGEVEIRWRGAPGPARWVVPADSVVWLDAANASAEEIASTLLDAWVAGLVAENVLAFPESEYRFELTLEEAPGNFAVVFRQ